MYFEQLRNYHAAADEILNNAGVKSMTDPLTEYLPSIDDEILEDPFFADVFAKIPTPYELEEYAEREDPCGGRGWTEDADNWDWSSDHTAEEEDAQSQRENERRDEFAQRLAKENAAFYNAIMDAEIRADEIASATDRIELIVDAAKATTKGQNADDATHRLEVACHNAYSSLDALKDAQNASSLLDHDFFFAECSLNNLLLYAHRQIFLVKWRRGMLKENTESILNAARIARGAVQKVAAYVKRFDKE